MEFYKYHGTGNDFILIDNRQNNVALTNHQVAALCHRRFGIGADGLMLLDHADGYDFRMVYYNADGGESTMCGNGGRCITAFARHLGIIRDKAKFLAIDGEHTATIFEDGLISLHMQNVNGMQVAGGHVILNTGSPHYVQWVDNVAGTDVFNKGKSIRYSDQFMPGGINVNFVQTLGGNRLKVRTYERGVEDETMSCGTGATAAAIAATGTNTGIFVTHIETPGGNLEVSFNKPTPDTATDVILTGPAKLVFKGEMI
jgi:diaminopimelate epimerase